MPEGPECRRYAEALAKRVSGCKLKSIEVLSGRFTKKPPSGLETFQEDLPVDVVGAGVHGKFIYWILNDEFSIWSTLGMTGQWSSTPSKHARVKFVLNDGDVFFNDQRNFGTLKFVRGRYRLIEKLKSLGPDILTDNVTDEIFMSRIRQREDWQVTKALMDQSIISGIGNYIKSDALWLAKISPKRSVGSLAAVELSNLNRAVQQVARESYEAGGATIQSYEGFDGEIGEYSQRFLVYNQERDPDGNEIIRELTEDQRTTHWVPTVQK
jgi:formamidopyrimidine-DNA glycosylase